MLDLVLAVSAALPRWRRWCVLSTPIGLQNMWPVLRVFGAIRCFVLTSVIEVRAGARLDQELTIPTGLASRWGSGHQNLLRKPRSGGLTTEGNCEGCANFKSPDRGKVG